MMSKTLALLSCISVVLFPWPLTACLMLGMSLFEPFIPLVAGALFDVFYYVPYGAALPLATLYGALASIVAFFVRSRLVAGIIRE